MALPEADYVEFFIVQDTANAARLRGRGEPWPQQPSRAALGEGVYAWASQDEAEAYRRSLLEVAEDLPVLEIVSFRVSAAARRMFRQLDVDALADDDAEAWLARYSRLWGGTPDHNLEYIQRGTNFGVEHFFARSVFQSLQFAE